MLEAGLKPGHSAEFRPPRWQAAGLRRWDKFLLVLGLARVIIRTAVEPFNQRHWVDVKDEDLVKQVEELVEIPGTTTEERGVVVLARGQPSDLFDVPDPITITTLALTKVLGSKRQ